MLGLKVEHQKTAFSKPSITIISYSVEFFVFRISLQELLSFHSSLIWSSWDLPELDPVILEYDIVK